MIIKDLIYLVGREKRRRENIKVFQKIATGAGVAALVGVATGILFAPKSGKQTREDIKKKAVNTVETFKYTVQKNAHNAKDSATHAVQGVRNVIKGVHVKTEFIKKDIKDGCHEISQDVHKTVENISNDLDKVVR